MVLLMSAGAAQNTLHAVFYSTLKKNEKGQYPYSMHEEIGAQKNCPKSQSF